MNQKKHDRKGSKIFLYFFAYRVVKDTHMHARGIFSFGLGIIFSVGLVSGDHTSQFSTE